MDRKTEVVSVSKVASEKIIRGGGVMNNLPPGVTVNQIPGWREEDVQRDRALDNLTEELQDLIDHYRQEYPILTDDDIKDTLDTVKPA
mgnify:CR=1 FL=1|jgi:hypothetical protein